MIFDKFTFFPDIDLYFDQNMDDAKKLIDIIGSSGCEYVKFAMCVNNPVMPGQESVLTWVDSKKNKKEQNLYEIFEERKLDEERAIKFLDFAKKSGLKLVASVYDDRALEICSDYVQAIKLSSSNITNFYLLDKSLKKNLPIILDTGKSTIDEVESAVNFVKKNNKDIELLIQHSPASPPAKPNKWSLGSFEFLKKKFNLPIGLSEHSDNYKQTMYAIAAGVINVEKGIMLDTTYEKGTSDSSWALPVSKLGEYLNLIEETRGAFASQWHNLDYDIIKKRDYERHGLYASKNIKKGEKFSQNNIKAAAPQVGLSASEFFQLIGKVAFRDILEDSAIKNDDFRDK